MSKPRSHALRDPARRRRLALLSAGVVVLALGPTASAAPDSVLGPRGNADDTFGYVPTMLVEPFGIDWLSGFPDGTAYVKHSDGGHPLLARSTDFGETWTQLADPPDGDFAVTKFASPARGYSLALGKVYTSDDGAASWQPAQALPPVGGGIPSPSGMGVGTGAFQSTVYVGGDEFVFANQRFERLAGTTIYGSQDGGKTWVPSRLPGDYFVDDIRVLDDKRAVANMFDLVNGSGNTTAIWTTQDGGLHWTRSFDCPVICTSVAFAGANTIFAGTTDGRLFTSTDGGLRWELNELFAPLSRSEAPPTKTHWVTGISFTPDGRTGVVGTNGRGTFRTTDGGATWSRELPSTQDVYGVGIGSAVIFDEDRALVGGPTALAVRDRLAVPTEQAVAPAANIPTARADSRLVETPQFVRFADGRVETVR